MDNDYKVSPYVFVGLPSNKQYLVRNRYIPMESIISYFINYFNISKKELFTSSSYSIMTIRKWIMLFAQRSGKYSLTKIAIELGYTGRDYISSTLKRFKEQLLVDQVLQKEFLLHLDNLKKLYIIFD
jgi:chromosomal replication initiation ATPase DnaA